MGAAKRGDVFLAGLDPTLGVEIKTTRPVIIVSSDPLNRYSQLAVVVPLTRNTAHVSPSQALIPARAAELSAASKAVTEQIKVIDQRRLIRRLGTLPPEHMAEIERAIKNTLALG